MENHAEPSRNPQHLNRANLLACLTVLALVVIGTCESSAERSFYTEADLTPIDFPVFYLGGKVALERGRTPLYYPVADTTQGYTFLYKFADDASAWAQLARANGFSHALQFTNPPFSAVLMAPFALLPWRWSYFAWQCVIIVLAAASVFMALSLVPGRLKVEVYALAFAAVCFFFPFKSTLVFGQANVSILFLWTLGVYLLQRRRPVASAWCFALGTVLKIAPVVAVPFFALRRQWRWLAAYVVGLVAFTGISVAVLGWQTNVTWITKIYPSISPGVGSVGNRSLAGLLNLLFVPHDFAVRFADTGWPVPHPLALFEKACSAAIGIGFIVWCWRKRRDFSGLVDELVLLPVIYLLIAPFSWPHHFVMAILPLVYLWSRRAEATFGELLTLALSTLALGTELPMYLARFSPLAGPDMVILATAIWPAATVAILWVGLRIYLRGPLPQAIAEA